MNKPERQLRLLQLACIVFLVLIIVLVHFGVFGDREPNRVMNLTQGLVVGAAVWSAVSGFTGQRRLASIKPRSQEPAKKSTPFTRWRAGHLLRLWSAMAVGIWGLVLRQISGPSWVVVALFLVSLTLLLAWNPGSTPAEE